MQIQNLLSLTYLSLLVLALSLLFVGRAYVAQYYVISAETVAAQARKDIEAKVMTNDKKEEALLKTMNYYLLASSLSPKSDMIYRRAGIVFSQYIDVIAQKYEDTKDDATKKKLIDSLGYYIDISTELSRRATDLAPEVYANWGARASIYSKYVASVGLNSYTKSAVSSYQKAAELNPLNYDLYYNAAQLYVASDDSTSAMRALNQVFAINPSHVPSLLLAAQVSRKDKDYNQAKRFLIDSKSVLEEIKQTDSEIYSYVNTQLGEIENLIKGSVSPSNKSNESINTSTDTTKQQDSNTQKEGSN